MVGLSRCVCYLTIVDHDLLDVVHMHVPMRTKDSGYKVQVQATLATIMAHWF